MEEKQRICYTHGTMKKPEIVYPRQWEFRVIGTDKALMTQAVAAAMADREYELSEANRKGKYLSLNLKVSVDSQEERNLIFNALKSAPSVTMVL